MELVGVALGLFVVYDTLRFLGLLGGSSPGGAGALDLVTLALAYVALVGVLYLARVFSRPQRSRGR